MEDRLIDGANDGRTDKTRRGGRDEREVMRNLSKLFLYSMSFLDCNERTRYGSAP